LGESFSIEVPNRREAIAPAMETAEAWLEKVQAPPRIVYFVDLAIEEIVTNCIHYGYSDDREHTILITLAVADETIIVTIKDDGDAFDPLAAPSPDFSIALKDRTEGGLGIHLLRNLADRVSYERRDGTNEMTLVKKLG
jgi:serine/threonine-protein kinase RsbW